MRGPLKYATPLIVYILGIMSFNSTGIVCWFALLFTWVVIPGAELFVHPDPKNLASAEETLVKKNKWYDYLLYGVVAAQYTALVVFLFQMKYGFYSNTDAAARVITMGLLCGVFGINIGHELGHRSNKLEQTLARALLLTSLYMHFFIEHNKGHHKNVATKEDPATARLWEPVYTFYFRSILLSYVNAWKIAGRDSRKKGRPVNSIYNEMVQIHLIQAAFLLCILLSFGWLVTLYYVIAACIGIGLLETVNYIEHYGLLRRETGDGKYERAMPCHSWNSDHIIGRLMLFELSRHSDHHYLASRKYQVLRHHDDTPQMPTGYPGMMILSLVPPLWFYIMHRQLKQFNESIPAGIKPVHA